MRAERHGFEYYRHGTLSLYAALNTRTGEVVGHTAARHTSAEFVGFLQTVVETQPRRREMHIIVDNLSAHKTQQVRTFLVAHPSVHLHYTPTYSSWLNQVERWFALITQRAIRRGSFTSVIDLKRKIVEFGFDRLELGAGLTASVRLSELGIPMRADAVLPKRARSDKDETLQKALEDWGSSVEKASGGTIKYKVFPAQQLGKAFDHYDMARDGIADLTYINPGYQPGRFPLIGAGELPFLVTNAKGGSIVLMHLGGWNTYDALPSMVRGLTMRGLQPTTISDLADGS